MGNDKKDTEEKIRIAREYLARLRRLLAREVSHVVHANGRRVVSGLGERLHPSLGPCGGLIPAPVEDSRDQDVSVVPIVDDKTLDNERADTVAELGSIATHAGLFDE